MRAGTQVGNREILHAVVAQSTVELFESYGVTLRENLASPKEPIAGFALCGVLGFSGEDMRGMLMVAATHGPLARTLPDGDSCVRDWSAEITNQLLGRIKNHLSRRGATFYLSTPVVIAGERLAPVPNGEAEPHVFCGDADGEAVCVWMDCEFAAGLALSCEAESGGGPSEGEAILF